MPSRRDQVWAAGWTWEVGAPWVPPEPGGNGLVGAGASPAVRRWALIASAKEPTLACVPLSGHGHVELGWGWCPACGSWLRGCIWAQPTKLLCPTTIAFPPNCSVLSSCLMLGHLLLTVSLGVETEAALWRGRASRPPARFQRHPFLHRRIF